MKNVFLWGLLWIASCTSSVASAFELYVSQKRLNSILTLSFPLEHDYEGFATIFSSPKVVLNPSKNTIEIFTEIDATREGKHVSAIGIVEGQFVYDADAQKLLFYKPLLKKFSVIDSQFDLCDPTLRQLENNVGNLLPYDVAIDFTQLNFGFSGLSPKAVSITERGLSISL